VLSAAGHHDCALNHRMHAKCDSPISCSVIEGGIESSAAMMARWLGARIELIEQRRSSMPESVGQLTLPGNTLALLSDEEVLCRKWQQRFIKMIPKKRRRFYPLLGAE
jgi:hypothetical protein